MFAWLKHAFPPVVRREVGIYRKYITTLGVWGSLRYLLQCLRPQSRGQLYKASPLRAIHPIFLRGGSSDADVFRQIFVDTEYAPLCGLSDVGLIIDCGANVGYSSAFFLSQFPSSHVIAVEPDSDNFAALQRNLLPYGTRVTLYHAGVWSQTAPLMIERSVYRDGREWATQVRACGLNEPAEFEGISIDTLLEKSGFDRISILKVDIEGAEAVVFRENFGWLDKVDALAIEIHDDTQFGKASEVFEAAVVGQDFEFCKSGELTIAYRAGRLKSV